ncbi:ubiquitin-specific protease ubp2 [Ascosphaera atra]|nr:ubiquitin-specific protease ubp2 [Ascosphaera atra]
MEGLTRPGKTAPLFADDIRRYDPHHPPSSGFNLLTGIPPIDSGTPVELLSPDACQHDYILKPRQTASPPNGNEAVGVPYKVAAVCAKCRQHIEITLIYPTPWGHRGKHPHHYVYLERATEEAQKKNAKNPFRKERQAKQEFHFVSSYDQCPISVTVKILEPVLSAEFVELLTSADKQKQRSEAARKEAPERYAEEQGPNVKWTIYALRRYIENAIGEEKRGRLIKATARAFSLAFGPRGEPMAGLFEALGFTYQPPDTENADAFWKPPEPSAQAQQPLEDSFLVYLDNLSYELLALERTRPASDGPDYDTQFLEPASQRINHLLGINQHVPRDTTWSWVTGNADEICPPPHFRQYYDLGVIRSASPVDVIEAYQRQCLTDTDAQRRRYYLRCLRSIGIKLLQQSDHRVYNFVSTEVETNNKYTDEDLALAYLEFGMNPFDTNDTTDEQVLLAYKLKAETATDIDDLKKKIFMIGDSRGSELVLHASRMPFPSVKQALEFFAVEKETPDDFVISMFTTKLLDNESSGAIELAREALQVIAEERNSDMLKRFLETGEISESEMDVGKALALLQSPPEADDSSLMAAFHSCCIDAPGRIGEFNKALDVISKDRGHDVRNVEMEPQPPPLITAPQADVGRPDWPVGLFNIANTCYLNSLLQFYFTITPFREMILNHGEYLMTPNRENLKKKRVGMRLVYMEEIKRSQRWIKKMSELFNEMITSPYAAVTPTKLLAALTLYRSSLEYANARRDSIGRRESITSPPLPPRAASPPPEKLENGAVSGPLGPSVGTQQPGEGDDVEMKEDEQVEAEEATEGQVRRKSIDSQATAISSSGQEPNGTDAQEAEKQLNNDVAGGSADVGKEQNAAKEGTDQDVEMLDASDREAPSHDKATADHVENADAAPEPVEPPSREPPSVPEEDEDAEIPLEYGAQQDVTEVISNVMFQTQCAIKPEGFAPDGEQEDMIKRIFYGKTKTYSEARKGRRSTEELFSDVKVNVASGPTDIYGALDGAFDFQQVTLGDEEVEQYAAISQIPPVLQVQVQRVQYDLEKQQAFKSNNHLGLKETIYMDRYMDSTDDQIIQRRKKVKEMKNKLEALTARKAQLVSSPDSSSGNESIADTFREAREKVNEMAELQDDPSTSSDAIDIPEETSEHLKVIEEMTKEEIAGTFKQRDDD